MIKITRMSMLTGLEHTMELDITEEQLARFNAGAMVQHAFPHLKPAEREFILNGTTEEEWNAAFPEDGEDS